ELPAWPHMMHLCVLLQNIGCIVRGIESESVHENLVSGALPEQPLHTHQVLCRSGADAAARGIHEIDEYDLVLDQIVIEAHLLVLLRGQQEVGKVALADDLAGRSVSPAAAGILPCGWLTCRSPASQRSK